MKKGFELSINFLVTIILLIVMFTFSVAITTKMFLETRNTYDLIVAQINEKLDELMSQGKTVALVPGRSQSEINENAIFGLGIWNIGNNQPETAFRINVSYEKGFSNDEEDISYRCGNGTQYCGEFFEVMLADRWIINNAEKKKDTILIKPKKGAIHGTHIFNVAICNEDSSGQIKDASQVCDGYTIDMSDPSSPKRRLNKEELYDGTIYKLTLIST
jgi:hypothetical protein